MAVFVAQRSLWELRQHLEYVTYYCSVISHLTYSQNINNVYAQ